MAVYGANASGKSKLFEAMAFLKVLLSNARKKDGDYLWKKMYDNFRLSTETRDSSSEFEIVFIIDDKQYRYGIELTKEKIISEYLFVKENKRETEIFQRYANEIIGKEKLGKIGKNLIESNMIRNDMPFLSALNEWNDQMAAKIFQWFQGVVIISGNELPPVPLKYLVDKDSKDILLSFLKIFDINIEDISLHEVSINDIPEKIRKMIGEDNLVSVHSGLKTSHKVYDEHYSVAEMCSFQMEKDESYGTNRLTRLFDPLFSSSVIIIDEFDSGIHPNILSVLISMFYNFKNLSKQLIINT
ncbi:MAG: ATP-binding protein, partial [Bacteroidales bacterium]|nr:ATP-binding protein [Bacteroidales bacterium]